MGREARARVAVACMLIGSGFLPASLAAPRNAGAVVLVNSQSPDYAEFRELLNSKRPLSTGAPC